MIGVDKVNFLICSSSEFAKLGKREKPKNLWSNIRHHHSGPMHVASGLVVTICYHAYAALA